MKSWFNVSHGLKFKSNLIFSVVFILGVSVSNLWREFLMNYESWHCLKKEQLYIDPDPVSPPQPGKMTRIKLVVDRENESSSTGEESTTETQQRNRLPNNHSNINGNIYLAQNGTIVRTRRPPHPNNLKVGSPCRLAKHFKKLDKLGVTHEEPPPIISIEGTGNNTENGTGTCVSSNVDVNLNTQSSLGPAITDLRSFGPKTNIAKALTDRNSSVPCVNEEQETSVDNHKDSRETLESHSDHTLSDEEELWMGPWNSLHIPMTKLWLAMQKVIFLFVMFLSLSCLENDHKSDDCVPQLDKLRSLSKTSDCTYSDILFNHCFYQGFITDRAITEGNLELQGNECLKEMFCEPCLTVVLWASFLSDSILCFLFTASVFCFVLLFF